MAKKQQSILDTVLAAAVGNLIEENCKFLVTEVLKEQIPNYKEDNNSNQMFASIWMWLAFAAVKSGKLPKLIVDRELIADSIATRYQAQKQMLHDNILEGDKREIKKFEDMQKEVVAKLMEQSSTFVARTVKQNVVENLEIFKGYLDDFYQIIYNDKDFRKFVNMNTFKNDEVIVEFILRYFSILGIRYFEVDVEPETKEEKIRKQVFEYLCMGAFYAIVYHLSGLVGNINENLEVFKSVYDHCEERWMQAEIRLIDEQNGESDSEEDDEDSDDEDYEEDESDDEDSDEDYEEDEDSDEDYEEEESDDEDDEESDDEDYEEDESDDEDDELPTPVEGEDSESSIDNLAENYGDDEYLELIDVRENKKELKEAVEDVAEEIEEENDEELPEGTLAMYTHILKRETLILNFASAKWLSENKHFINTCKKYKLDSQSLGLLILHYIYNLLIRSNLTPLKLAGYRQDLTIPKNYAEFATKTVLNMMNSLAEHMVTKASIKAGYTAEVPIKLADKIAEGLVSHVKKVLEKLYDDTHKNFMGLIDLAASQIVPNEAKAFAKKLKIKPTKDFISTYARMQATWVVGTYFYVTNFANDWTYEKDNMELSTNVKINVLFEFVYHYRRETNKQIAKLFKGATPEEIDELFNKEYLKHADKYNATIFKMLNSGGDDVLKRFKAKMAKMK